MKISLKNVNSKNMSFNLVLGIDLLFWLLVLDEVSGYFLIPFWSIFCFLGSEQGVWTPFRIFCILHKPSGCKKAVQYPILQVIWRALQGMSVFAYLWDHQWHFQGNDDLCLHNVQGFSISNVIIVVLYYFCDLLTVNMQDLKDVVYLFSQVTDLQ